MSYDSCEYMVGFADKAQCGNQSVAQCVNCGKKVCSDHVISTSEGMMCLNDASWTKSDATYERIVEYPEIDDAFWDDIS